MRLGEFNVGSVKIKLDLSRLRKNIKNAQAELANQILTDCKEIMPYDTGSLQQRSYISKDSKTVTFEGPYAHYLYVGKKMVSKIPGNGPFMGKDKYGNEIGLRYKKGTKLKYAEPEQKLKFTRPEAQAKWFEVAKTNNLKKWKQLVKDEIIKK